MRLIKNFEKSKATDFLSEIINSVMLEFGYNFFDRIEFKTGVECIDVKDGRAEIVIDENNKAVKERDSSFVRMTHSYL